MSDQLWSDVDNYLTAALHDPDPVLDAALEASREAGLPPIQVSANQGKLLQLLVRMRRARRVLEVGTLGGYSTIWMARGLEEGGHLLSLEIDPTHAEVARANLERAGVAGVAEVRLGRAADSLEALSAEDPEPFDFVFIDADKPSNADYFSWALRLGAPGTVIVVDNVVRGGSVADSSSNDEAVLGVRRLNDLIASTPTVSATGIQTVGTKGYDGFILALVA